jgi:signal transduction histidine kinase/CheY-like chemotaxis protein
VSEVNDPVLQAVTQGVFVLIWVIVLVDFARRPDRRRAEILALFTSLAAIILLQGLLRATGLELAWLRTVGALVVLAQPYLLLRLVAHFRPLPRTQARLGLVLLLGSWALFLLGGTPPAPWALLAIVLAFAYVEAYAAAAFVAEARRARGPTRRRLVSVALGSGLLGAVIVLAGLSALFPAAAPVLQLLGRVCGLASALGYFVGFSPPRWLSRVWQTDDLREALAGLAGRSTEERLGAALDLIGPAAAQAVGGVAGVVLLPAPDDAARLRVHVDPENRRRLEPAGVPDAELGPTNPVLTRAWRERRGLAATDPAWGPSLRGLAAAFGGASAALIAPLLVAGEPRGLLVVLTRGGSLFPDDDVRLLSILAEQAALAIESGRLYVEARGRAAERQALLDLVKAVSDGTDARVVAEKIVAHVDRLLPASTRSVLLPTADGGLEVVATGGEAADERRGRHLPPGAGLPAAAMREGRTMRSDDLEDAEPGLVPTRQTRALLAVPLRHDGAVIGVLCFGANRRGAFGSAETEVAEIVAAHAAVALGRARLFEALRQQNAALEEATRLKSEFLANMSHELRTPLNAVIGFSELLLDAPEGEGDRATDLAYLGTIHRNGQHLLALINDVLDLAKVEAGKMELRPERFDLDELVAQAVGMVAPLARRRRIALGVAGTAGAVVADAGKVKQMLLNLLSNAIKFTPEEGGVRVETARETDRVRLTVVDTGIGIAPEHHERIFHEFQQVDGAASRRYEGTGLGLALTRRFAELHGGRVWVESAPGAGSRFHLVLPDRDAPAEPAEPAGTPAGRGAAAPAADAAAAGRPLVLVVEDEPQAANLLALYLARGGYRTELARDGAEALEKARALRPDAITLDIMLPRLDGWEVLRGLKDDAATRDIPVVVASVVDNQSLGYALGAVDYFVKPIDRRALLARLERYRSSTARSRVLAVDDEPDALALVAETLRPAGYDVESASGGRAGIAAATARRPDVVLLDLMMPDVTGFDVVEALRADPRTRDVPVLIVTAKELTAEEKALLSGRVAGVLQKGTGGAVELLDWLDRIVGRRPAAGEVAHVG